MSVEAGDFGTVSKLEAAHRQLDSALSLWFADGDSISVHTLVGAAYQIIQDVSHNRGGPDDLLNSEFVPARFRDELRGDLRRDVLFFRNADRDAGTVSVLAPVPTLLFLILCVQTLRDLNEKLTDHQMAFLGWTAVAHPELVTGAVRNTYAALAPEQRALMVSNGKRQFLKDALGNFALLRRQGKL